MMKASLGKLRRFAFNKIDGKDKLELLTSAQLDELAQASKDMKDMRDSYDRLLSAAAATANSAYEFSESLGEMGSCLENLAPHNDEESGKALLMLGRVQFELQKLVDNYRYHIFKTITHPSESFLEELQTVEDMKRQCDEKRDVYEYTMTQMKEKGRPKGGKGESVIFQQLQTAHSEFNEDATLCIFRLKSLKQGQSQSLLTQAARHHVAQVFLFRDGLKSLEAVEKHVRTVAEKQHIDIQISRHGNDSEDDGENEEDKAVELSFDYRVNTQTIDALSRPRNSMKMEEGDLSFPRPSVAEYAGYNREQPRASSSDPRANSHSAPLFMEKRPNLAEKFKQLQASTTYVLPVPSDSKNPSVAKQPSPTASNSRPTNHSHNIWHSSPLEQMKTSKDFENSKFSSQLPLPSSEGFQVPHSDSSHPFDAQKVKKQALSGLESSKPSSSKPVSSDTVSGQFSRLPIPQSSSPRASPPLSSSPRISELHELPRPPGNSVPPKRSKSPGLVGHSAPLTAPIQDFSSANRGPSTSVASPLPPPPLIFPRSFSIPSITQREMTLHVSKLLESPGLPEKSKGMASPPISPMHLANAGSFAATLPQVAATQTGRIRGGS